MIESGAVRNLAANMVGQESAGVLAGLILRLARFLGGDPSSFFTVTSTSSTDTQLLPDDVRAESAILFVTGQPLSYRVDGGDPGVVQGPAVAVGSTILLTGKPTIKGFRFVAQTVGNASVLVTYFT